MKIDIGKERTDQYKSKANEYQCRLCLEKLIGIDVINPTLQNEEYSCQFCELKMKEESELREHEATHTQQSAINCDICDKVVKTQKDLDAHMTNHAGTSSIKCPICDYKAKTAEEVQGHMNSHDNTGTNVIKGLEESCKKLEEEILIERKSNEKNVSYIQELEEKIKTLSVDLEQSKQMVISEIRKNGEKQETIEELEKVIREKDRNSNDNDTKIALERAKDVIVEYKSEISRVTKEKDIENRSW